jgi:chorismate synthase
MPGNSFGRLLTLSTFGESHGPAVGGMLDGVPPGITLSEAVLQHDLDRRRPGQSAVTTERAESDTVEILSGVFEGKTTGMPIAFLIRNFSARSGDYESLKDVFRPGHADWPYFAKYGSRDWRGGGRSSGRETAARVAAGAVAKAILARRGITVLGCTVEIAGVQAEGFDPAEIERNPVRSPDAARAPAMIAEIEKAKQAGDSVGGIAEVRVSGCPAGLGEPVFDKLEALLAHAIMSIGAARSVEVGAGVGAARMRGSRFNDELAMDGGRVTARTNNAGGIAGGISTGADIVVRAAFRPPASISLPQESVNVAGEPVTVEVRGRHDPCIVPRAVPVMEAMTALVIADCLLIQDAREGNSGGR